MGSIYLNGSVINAGKLVKFNGTSMANVYLNGTKLWTAYTPVATFYSSGTSTEAINDNISQINIQMVGGGGGGRKNGTVDGTGGHSAGGTTTVVVKTAGGSTRTTFTAAGGAAGDSAGVGGSFAAGEDGESFANPSGADSSFVGTGGAGGAYNTNNAGSAGGIGSGGGGMGQAGGGSAAHGGSGGDAGTFYTTTYTIVDVTDYLEITVGAGGSKEGTVRDGAGGGVGGSGRVRILGIV